ncbi:MAG: hypothetical protein K5739_10730 [Lachnospiraceae bacterium]|nr:hypothetical protein [Lachnospiraceae bacterium]
MKKKVLICDRQADFVSLLQRNLSGMLSRAGIDVYAYDDVEKLLESPEVRESSLTLIGESLLSAFDTEKLLSLTKKVVYLTEERRGEGIFKYQSAGALQKQILRLLLEDEDFSEFAGPAGGEHRAKIIAFYSPVRPLLQSSLALTLGQILAKEHKSLYLNFEPYSGMEYLMQREFSKGLTELLFYIKNEDSRLAWRLESLAEKVGELSFIPPVFAYPDLEEVQPEGFWKLISRIARETEYEYLLLDLSELNGIFTILENCDMIFCPYVGDPLAMAKVDRYEKMLEFLEYNRIFEKTNRLALPGFSRLPEGVTALCHSQMADYIKEKILPLILQEGCGVSNG